DAARWLCGIDPSRFDRIYFDATTAGYTPTAFTVTLPPGSSSDPIRAQALRVRTDTVTLNLTSRPLVLDEDQGLNDPSLVIGDIATQPAALSVRNTIAPAVEFTAGSVVIGEAPTNPGQPLLRRLTVSDAAADFRATGDLYVGRRGDRGELVVQAGAGAVVEGLVSVGTDPGSVGEVRVINSGSLLLHNDEGRSMGVGVRGAGTLRIGGPGLQAGADVATLGRMDTLTVGLLPGGSGNVRISGAGSSWTVLANRIFFGYAAPTSLIIENGALLDTDTLSEVIIGRYPESAPSVEIRGAGSRWIERRQAITIGRSARVILGPGASIEAVAINVLDDAEMRGQGTVGSFSLGRDDGTRIVTDVFNFGAVAPAVIDEASGAEQPGFTTLTVLGNYRQFGPPPGASAASSGELRLDIGSVAGEADALLVSGEATLGGSLIVERAESTPLRGSTAPITMLSADGGISGFFDVAYLPSTGDPATFFRPQTATSAAASRAERGPLGTSVVLTVQDLLSLINTSSSGSEDLPGEPAAAVVADFDNQNGPDVALVIPDQANPATARGELIILSNQGTVNNVWQGWSVTQYTDAPGVNPRAIAAGELDGVPGIDLVVADAGDDTVSVLRNGGAGVFLPRVSFAVGDEPRGVTAADLDGDGFADVATANTSAGTASILRNQQAPGGTWLGLGQS
ncbi:MAG: FG-GAP-like repeat-containing protein, partial [Planctomycetota bacterium]|nr:FG-GAP-like repeat-containing protein [Planctomycetota bacterium]